MNDTTTDQQPSKEDVMAKEPQTDIPSIPSTLHIGIDVGSTTVKLAILDEAHNVKFSVYRRHHADGRATLCERQDDDAAD